MTLHCFGNWYEYNSTVMVLSNSLTTINNLIFNSWRAYNQPNMTIPSSVTTINGQVFQAWRAYDRDFVFEHTTTIPFFDSSGYVWNLWNSYFPARITTPNSTRTNAEWKTAIGDINYNDGDIESINGVLWGDIA